MDILALVLEILDTDMTRPEMFGWFHWLWIGITVAGTVLLCRYCKASDDQAVRKVVLITSIVVAVLEIYKQINYTFTVENGSIVTDYQWYAFPFQFCSTPMYVGLIAGIVRRGKVRDALYAFLATYGVFAGLCVMIYPNDVFCGTLGINIQTMICHGSMIAVGIYLLYSGQVRLEHKTVFKALSVFATAVTMAVVMNEIAYRCGLVSEETFNMFFVSPYCEPSLPVYSLVQAVVPFPWCLVIYIAAFTLASYIILLSAMLCKRLFVKRKVVIEAREEKQNKELIKCK